MNRKDLSIPIEEKSLATSFKDIRKRLNLTQDDFAHLLKVRPRTISRWENGATEPMMTVTQFKCFLKALKQAGISLNDIPDN